MRCLAADASADGVERALDDTNQAAARHRPDRHHQCTRHEHYQHSLWTIAGRVLDTDDPRRIARYWPRLHRANRSLIGATPDLIRPGWVLTLPGECD